MNVFRAYDGSSGMAPAAGSARGRKEDLTYEEKNTGRTESD